MNREKLLSVIGSVVLVVLPLVSSSWLSWYVVRNEQQISGLQYSTWFLIAIVCCLASTVAITPPTFLALVFGYFLGWKSLPLLFFLNMTAILLVNLVFKFFKFEFSETFLGPKAVKLLERIKQDELKIIFFTKISPVLPFALTNVVFAMSGAKTKNILLGGFMGMIPRTVLAVWSSLQIRNIKHLLENPNQDSKSQAIIVAMFLLSVLGLVFVLQRSLSKQQPS
jgi:uncharacterized membrane protein YdjX (TVP38/TMEM64 family)